MLNALPYNWLHAWQGIVHTNCYFLNLINGFKTKLDVYTLLATSSENQSYPDKRDQGQKGTIFLTPSTTEGRGKLKKLSKLSHLLRTRETSGFLTLRAKAVEGPQITMSTKVSVNKCFVIYQFSKKKQWNSEQNKKLCFLTKTRIHMHAHALLPVLLLTSQQKSCCLRTMATQCTWRFVGRHVIRICRIRKQRNRTLTLGI